LISSIAERGGGGYDMDEVGVEIFDPFKSSFSETYQGKEVKAVST